jgi:hypothetical protein
MTAMAPRAGESAYGLVGRARRRVGRPRAIICVCSGLTERLRPAARGGAGKVGEPQREADAGETGSPTRKE